MEINTGDLLTPFEKGNGNQTCTYEECITFYERLDSLFDEAKLFYYGSSSVGKPVHLLVISGKKNFDPQKIHEDETCVLLINNGIHPGEPDGIDASMMFARDLLTGKIFKPIPENVVVCIIPVYNIAGMLNRNTSSRANQNGPEEYGFRGTAQNYDLNRDFVKCDSKETEAFTEIFQTWKPEIFIDTHVSNGADYQYVMTLIATQKDKMNPILSSYQENTFLPDLYSAMKVAQLEMTPYVNPIAETPDSGIVAFLETPRYSTGYATLFNCIGMMPETHMLKPYEQRVRSTYVLEHEVLKIVKRDATIINQNKAQADETVRQQKSFTINWELNEDHFEWISFKGYEAKKIKSEVTDSMRLWYDRNEPYERKIKFFNQYDPAVSAEKPFAYIVPQGWENVIDRLQWNKVEMKQISKDTSLSAEVYYVENFKTTQQAFEGHYLHSKVEVRKETQHLNFYKGDYVVFPNQNSNRYIVEMLEPTGHDSYFAWNFFDPILMTKEHFSAYVFEDIASDILNNDATLKKDFEAKKDSDPQFASDPEARLDFIYRRSAYFEKAAHRRYPVARIMKQVNLPLD